MKLNNVHVSSSFCLLGHRHVLVGVKLGAVCQLGPGITCGRECVVFSDVGNAIDFIFTWQFVSQLAATNMPFFFFFSVFNLIFHGICQ